MASLAEPSEAAEEGKPLARFLTPVVHANTIGWGPTQENIPKQLRNVPFAPFGKGDRLGRAADFTPNQHSSRYQRYRDRRSEEGAQNNEFQYRYDATEDSSFSLVDTTKTQTKRFGGPKRQQWRGGRGGRGRWGDRHGRGGRDDGRGGRGGRGDQQQRRRNDPRFNDRRGGRGGGDRRRNNQNRVDRQASVKVQADWQVIEEFDLAQFTKLQANKPVAEDLKWCGFLDAYDEAYDRIASTKPVPLHKVEKEFYHCSTTDDPVIGDIAVEGPGDVTGGSVYATDVILAHLMACPRSVYPWDIVVQKLNGCLFFDKRDSSQFDYLTVNETAYDPPAASEDPDAINTPGRLSIEASIINQNFTQQILKDDGNHREAMEFPNPFYDEEESPGAEPASFAYRYRKFTLGNINLISRCELHGMVTKRGEKQFMTSFALNEWDSKISGGDEWRQKIDIQRGAVLATELKNNSCKLAKWTAQSIIAGAEQMKIGYVSRKSRTDNLHHVILATQFYKPTDFANQITLSVTNMWGIIKMFVDKFMSLEDGKFVIMKDPNKAVIRIYRVPPETFEEEDEEEDEEAEDPEAAEEKE